MALEFPSYRAAAVQAAPVFLNLEETVEKTRGLIEEAASNGAKLVVFPEAFIPGYPWWIWFDTTLEDSVSFFETLYKNAVAIPSDSVRKIGAAARDNEIYVCVSVSERDGGSLYLTQLWFNPSGNLIGKHRKFKATNAERAIWGDGRGDMAPVFDTEYGFLGGLQCAEHMIPLNVTAMNSLNEQVHAASWPAFLAHEGSLLSRPACETASKYYAIVNQVFCLMSSQIFTEEMRDMVVKNEDQLGLIEIGSGCTKIFSPQGGQVVGNEVPADEEGIAYADIDLSVIPSGKYFLDPAGHYSTPGFLRMVFDRTPMPPVTIIGEQGNHSVSYENLPGNESVDSGEGE